MSQTNEKLKILLKANTGCASPLALVTPDKLMAYENHTETPSLKLSSPC